MVLQILVIALFIIYSFLIIYYWRAWKSIPDFKPGENQAPLKISLIIPARNEENNIGKLLSALSAQTYPSGLTEIIVINDHSTDRTAEEVKKFSFAKLINLEADELNSYKKKAIEQGIEASTGELIVTTDADCIPGPEWLKLIVAFKQKQNAVFIAAPVVFENNSSILQQFQAMDFLILQGITAAAVYKKALTMCNGANLAYEKKAFEHIGGFREIDQIASGDDMLLMYKISKLYPDRLGYLKSKLAIVSTEPMKTWKAFFNQRIRWASKATFYNDKRIFLVLLLVYAFNFSFLSLAVAGFFHWQFWIWLLGIWLGKTLVELPFFISVARFFNKEKLTPLFFFFQPLHILYTILSGLFGQFGKYEWKGRKVR